MSSLRENHLSCSSNCMTNLLRLLQSVVALFQLLEKRNQTLSRRWCIWWPMRNPTFPTSWPKVTEVFQKLQGRVWRFTFNITERSQNVFPSHVWVSLLQSKEPTQILLQNPAFSSFWCSFSPTNPTHNPIGPTRPTTASLRRCKKGCTSSWSKAALAFAGHPLAAITTTPRCSAAACLNVVLVNDLPLLLG